MDYGMQMVESEKPFSNKIQKIASNHYRNQFYCWNKRKRILSQETFYLKQFLIIFLLNLAYVGMKGTSQVENFRFQKPVGSNLTR